MLSDSPGIAAFSALPTEFVRLMATVSMPSSRANVCPEAIRLRKSSFRECSRTTGPLRLQTFALLALVHRAYSVVASAWENCSRGPLYKADVLFSHHDEPSISEAAQQVVSSASAATASVAVLPAECASAGYI